VAAGAVFPPAALAAWPSNARVLILSAYPTEGAKLLAGAAPVTEVGVFNGRRFFAGTIAGKNVVMGLTGIGLVDADRTTRAVLAYLEDSDFRLKASSSPASPAAPTTSETSSSPTTGRTTWNIPRGPILRTA